MILISAVGLELDDFCLLFLNLIRFVMN